MVKMMLKILTMTNGNILNLSWFCLASAPALKVRPRQWLPVRLQHSFVPNHYFLPINHEVWGTLRHFLSIVITLIVTVVILLSAVFLNVRKIPEVAKNIVASSVVTALFWGSDVAGKKYT